jgi:hypothetical protein
MFVDKFPISPVLSDFIFPVDIIKSKPTWKLLLEDAALEAGNLDDTRLSAIAKWVTSFLSTQRRQIALSRSSNELLLSVLKLLKYLVQFGYFKKEGAIVDLFLCLVEVLDGKSDVR